jgi:hypothetical protein
VYSGADERLVAQVPNQWPTSWLTLWTAKLCSAIQQKAKALEGRQDIQVLGCPKKDISFLTGNVTGWLRRSMSFLLIL